jgi:hypothetical protein
MNKARNSVIGCMLVAQPYMEASAKTGISRLADQRRRTEAAAAIVRTAWKDGEQEELAWKEVAPKREEAPARKGQQTSTTHFIYYLLFIIYYFI